MRVLLMGPPGVGKGTQAALMSSYLDVPAIATGDMLRAAVESGSALGKTAQEIMAKGELVPDALMIDLIASRLGEDDAKKGFILDGFPRTVEQAKALSTLLKDLNLNLDAVFFLDADESQVVERLGGRMTCPDCGRTYHASKNPPKRSGVCDFDGCSLIVRDDDHPDAIMRRLVVYHERTAPVLDYYEEVGLLKRIDSSGSIEDVWSEIRSLLST